MSWLEKRKRKKERDEIRRWEQTESPVKIKEKLEQARMEKERLKLKKELRESEKDISRLKHPTQTSTISRIKKAGSRAIGFTGELAHEGARSYSKTKTTLRRKGRTIRQMPRQRSFQAPDGGDISLSGAIARADWHGGRNVMNTQFFGSDTEQPDKDFFGQRKMDTLVNNKKKNKYF